MQKNEKKNFYRQVIWCQRLIIVKGDSGTKWPFKIYSHTRNILLGRGTVWGVAVEKRLPGVPKRLWTRANSSTPLAMTIDDINTLFFPRSWSPWLRRGPLSLLPFLAPIVSQQTNKLRDEADFSHWCLRGLVRAEARMPVKKTSFSLLIPIQHFFSIVFFSPEEQNKNRSRWIPVYEVSGTRQNF